MILLAFCAILQIACCVHVVRSGRPLYWILILLMFSMLAVVVYLLVAVIPDMQDSPTARRQLQRARDGLDRGREKRQAAQQLAMTDSIDNRLRMAQAHIADDEYAEAEALLRGARDNALYRDDPNLLLTVAQVEYAQGRPHDSRATLEALIAANPEFRSHEGHLLYARSLEDSGDKDAALHEYEVLAISYPGEEGRLRHARLLAACGQTAQAKAVYHEIQQRANAAPDHYRRLQREWIEQARSELKQLGD